MKLPAYPRTKPSGVEWLGDVPEHWAAQGVKFCYSIQLGKMLQPEPASPNDEETPYLKSQHVQWEHVRVADLPTMWTNKKIEVGTRD
jgi:type I restriction enzyme S subunit